MCFVKGLSQVSVTPKRLLVSAVNVACLTSCPLQSCALSFLCLLWSLTLNPVVCICPVLQQLGARAGEGHWFSHLILPESGSHMLCYTRQWDIQETLFYKIFESSSPRVYYITSWGLWFLKMMLALCLLNRNEPQRLANKYLWLNFKRFICNIQFGN